MNDYERIDENDITAEPALTPAQQRLRDDASSTFDEVPVYVTSDGYPTSLDQAPDITKAGMASDASVGGLGADLDSMPGDETPISP